MSLDIIESILAASTRPNQSLEPTADRQVNSRMISSTVNLSSGARSRQRWLSFVSLGPMKRHAVSAAAALLASVAIARSVAAASPLPLKSDFVRANGIKLHYLDWGGSGDTILFLPGFNDTAHIYDQFAPRFIDHFHVMGLTRRGGGESDKPKDGYDASTRVEDIRDFLDQLHILRVILIGHSMAGDELTLFASRYPQRTIKIVYYDAAYDRYT